MRNKRSAYFNWARMHYLNYLDKKMILSMQEEHEIREMNRTIDSMRGNPWTTQEAFNLSMRLVDIRAKYERRIKRLDFWYKWRMIIELIGACVLLLALSIYYILEVFKK